MTTKAKPEFRRENREGSYVYVKRLAIGGEVHRDGEEFRAYDADGHYLGFSNDQQEAELMASSGFTNIPHMEESSDLSWWVLWNDHVESGNRVFLGDDGEQVIAVRNDLYMVAKEDDRGWDIEIIDDVTLFDRYRNDTYDCVVELKIIPNSKAFRLE